MDRRVTPPKRVTSPTLGPPPPCKRVLRLTQSGSTNHEKVKSVPHSRNHVQCFNTRCVHLGAKSYAKLGSRFKNSPGFWALLWTFFSFLCLIFKKTSWKVPKFSLHQCLVSLCEVVATIFVKPYVCGLVLTFEREFALLLSVDVFVSSLKIKKKMVQTVHDLCYPSLERFRVTFTANVIFKLGISQNRKWEGKKPAQSNSYG